jgi:RNA polymerase sigma-70 factor (ECF subfamily)
MSRPSSGGKVKGAEPESLDARRRPTDPELFVALARGDLGPLGVLFDRYHEDVRQLLLRAAPGASDVDDLVQETFLTAARAAESYDGRPSARPFLIGVAAQLLRRRRRTFARFRALVDAFGSAPVATAPKSPEEATGGEQEAALVRSALERLSDDKRLVLVMVEWEGMSGPEVAKILDVPVGTVWRRLSEARTELRRVLERRMR